MTKTINLSNPNEYGELQKTIYEELIKHGFQSPITIRKLRREQFEEYGILKDFDEDMQRWSIINAFKQLVKEGKIILVDDSKKVVGGREKFYGLTDKGLDWYKEKFGIAQFDSLLQPIWQVSISLDEKYHEIKSRIQHTVIEAQKEKLNSKMLILKNTWNVERLFDYYMKRNNIPMRIVNPMGSARILDLLKRIEEKNFWIIDGKDYREKAISILKDYSYKKRNKIEQYERLALAGGSVVGKIVGELSSELLIYNYKISIFGILFLINSLDDELENEQIIANNRDELPLVFNEKIWSDIKLKCKNNAEISLIRPFLSGFGETFDNSFYWPELSLLTQLYHVEYNAFNKLVKLADSGLEILHDIAVKENCRKDFHLSLDDEIPKPLKKYEQTIVKFKKYYKMTGRNHQNFDNITNISIEEPIREIITFHFYSYLRVNNMLVGKESEWKDFLDNNRNVKEFLDSWYEEISKFSQLTQMVKHENPF